MTSGFVSEKELEKLRESGLEPRARVAEDSMSLYEKLQENKRIADEQFQERIKFQPPRGLDEDEVNFLEQKQREEERRRQEQEESERLELADFRRSSRATETSTIIFNLPKKKSEVKPRLAVKVITAKSKTTTTAIAKSPPTTKRKEDGDAHHKQQEDNPKKVLKSDENGLKNSLGILADYPSSDDEKETKASD